MREKNVQRVKFESLRGKFDDMRMEEGENVAQYVARIKEVVSAIKGATSKIDDDEVVYVAMKNEFDEDEATALVNCVKE